MTVGGFDLSVGASMSLSVMVASAAMVEFNLDGPVGSCWAFWPALSSAF